MSAIDDPSTSSSRQPAPEVADDATRELRLSEGQLSEAEGRSDSATAEPEAGKLPPPPRDQSEPLPEDPYGEIAAKTPKVTPKISSDIDEKKPG